MRNGPANAGYYGAYEWAREAQLKAGQTKNDLARYDLFIMFNGDLNHERWKVAFAGGVGGVAYWLAIYPVDLVKSSIQSDHIVYILFFLC